MYLSRSKLLAPLVALALAACGGVVYVPVPVQTPAPDPEPAQVAPPVEEDREPLEVTIGRPVRDRFVVHTNRPAYVAIFEVIPEQGVTIVRPASAQERFVVSGLTAVRAWWTTSTVSRTAATNPTRYIYAVASDEPLRLSEATFRNGAIRTAIGSRAYYSTNPYETMRALSRRYVAAVAEEEWAEDAFVVRPEAAAPAPTRVARVYCPDGTRFEVPADMADRVRCPRPTTVARRDPPSGSNPGHGNGHGRTASDDVVTPDSVVGPDNRRVRPRPPTRVGRGPIDRVREPVAAGNNGRGPVEKGGVPATSGGSNGSNGARGGSSGSGANNGENGNGRASDRADSVARGHGRGVTDGPAADTTARSGRSDAGRGNSGRRVSEAWNGSSRRTTPARTATPQPDASTGVRVTPPMDSLRVASPRSDEPRHEEPKTAQAEKAETPEKPVTPRAEEPKEEKPKADEPRPEQPADEAKAEKPKGDTPKGDTPKGDTPKGDTPKGETPKGDDAKRDPAPEAKSKSDSLSTKIKKSMKGRLNE